MLDPIPKFDIHTIIAALGGAMSFMVRSRDLTTPQRIAYGASGAIGAYYSAIGVSAYYELGSGSTAALGFVLGNIIVTIFDKAIDELNARGLFGTIRAIFDFILRRPPPPPGV